jgi:molecular chaperone DnaK
MKAEAEANAESDKKERETAEAVNKGDSIIFAQEKLIKEQESNLTSDEKEKLEGLVSNLKEAVNAKDVNKINELETSINETWQTISQRIYSQQPQGTATEQQATDEATAQSNEPQDADFEEVK